MKLAVFVVLPSLAGAAVLPDQIGLYRRTSTTTPALTDQAVWGELGLKESEVAVYQNGKAKFLATAYRLEDTTAALSAFDWRRAPGARPSPLAELAAETAQGVLVVHGNYLIDLEGYKPTATELSPILDGLRDVNTTPLPVLPGFLPSQGLVPNSERYIIGPATLKKFDPGIPPSVAAFHLGAEAQLGVFHSPSGDLTLAVFNYPTNQIAIDKQGDFQKLTGAVVKRSGPLLAVILSPSDLDAAERLLALVRYEAQVTLHEATPTSPHAFGNMLVNVFILIGILLAFSTVAGLFVGGVRTFLLRRRTGPEEEPMILLHLEQR